MVSRFREVNEMLDKKEMTAFHLLAQMKGSHRKKFAKTVYPLLTKKSTKMSASQAIRFICTRFP